MSVALDEEDMAALIWSVDGDANGLYVAGGRSDIGVESEEVLLAHFFVVAQSQFATYKNPTVFCYNLCNVFSVEMGVKRKDLQVQILSVLLKASGRDGGNIEIGLDEMK